MPWLSYQTFTSGLLWQGEYKVEKVKYPHHIILYADDSLEMKGRVWVCVCMCVCMRVCRDDILALLALIQAPQGSRNIDDRSTKCIIAAEVPPRTVVLTNKDVITPIHWGPFSMNCHILQSRLHTDQVSQSIRAWCTTLDNFPFQLAPVKL